MTLTLTLDPAIRHTVVHHSSTCTCIPNFIEIEETFCGRADGHFPPLILLGRLMEVDLMKIHFWPKTEKAENGQIALFGAENKSEFRSASSLMA